MSATRGTFFTGWPWAGEAVRRPRPAATMRTRAVIPFTRSESGWPQHSAVWTTGVWRPTHDTGRARGAGRLTVDASGPGRAAPRAPGGRCRRARRSRDGLTRQHAGHLLPIDGHLTVDHDVRNTGREPARVIVGCRVEDALGVEDDQVGEPAALD